MLTGRTFGVFGFGVKMVPFISPHFNSLTDKMDSLTARAVISNHDLWQVTTQQGFSFTLERVPSYDVGKTILRLMMKRPVGGVLAFLRRDSKLDWDEAGITAGINHGYIRAYCGHCFQAGKTTLAQTSGRRTRPAAATQARATSGFGSGPSRSGARSSQSRRWTPVLVPRSRLRTASRCARASSSSRSRRRRTTPSA